jgi:5-formyltetrahydrofolate cyclo-ligase
VTSTADRKAEVRAVLRAIRTAIPPDERLALGREVQQRLVALPAYLEATTVLLFYSFGSEIPTAGIIQGSLDAGKRVLLPLLEAGEMVAAELKPGDSLAATTYGPKEPSTRVAVDPEQVHLVVTPGLGFDRAGHRIGYGGGHYDRYLARLPAATLRVGIAFHQQLMDDLPTEPADQRVDLVVTDLEVIACPSRIEPPARPGAESDGTARNGSAP